MQEYCLAPNEESTFGSRRHEELLQRAKRVPRFFIGPESEDGEELNLWFPKVGRSRSNSGDSENTLLDFINRPKAEY